jgi:hypothetical protein
VNQNQTAYDLEEEVDAWNLGYREVIPQRSLERSDTEHDLGFEELPMVLLSLEQLQMQAKTHIRAAQSILELYSNPSRKILFGNSDRADQDPSQMESNL